MTSIPPEPDAAGQPPQLRRVRFLQPYRWHGRDYAPGDIADVPEALARELCHVHIRIAEYVGSPERLALDARFDAASEAIERTLAQLAGQERARQQADDTRARQGPQYEPPTPVPAAPTHEQARAAERDYLLTCQTCVQLLRAINDAHAAIARSKRKPKPRLSWDAIGKQYTPNVSGKTVKRRAEAHAKEQPQHPVAPPGTIYRWAAHLATTGRT